MSDKIEPEDYVPCVCDTGGNTLGVSGSPFVHEAVKVIKLIENLTPKLIKEIEFEYLEDGVLPKRVVFG